MEDWTVSRRGKAGVHEQPGDKESRQKISAKRTRLKCHAKRWSDRASFRIALVCLCLHETAAITCPPYTPPLHGKVAPTTSRTSGQRVTLTCNEGFVLSGDGDESPICLGEQGYSPGKVCQNPTSCGEYDAPIDGLAEPAGDIAFGNRVNISCNSGFVLDSSATRTPICRSSGEFEAGSRCERIPLACLSAFSSGRVDDSDPKFVVETCHPETQYCVTARSPDSTFIWRGCGPPVVRRGNESLVVLPEWAEAEYASSSALGIAWLSSNFVCQEGAMSGTAELPAQPFGAGVWSFQCCCSHSCNAGTKCVTNSLSAFRTRREESTTVTLHRECPLPSQGCYTVEAGGDDTGWRLQSGSFDVVEAVAEPASTARLVFETRSGRPPTFGEEFVGFAPAPRASTDSWLSIGTRVQFIDAGVVFPAAGAIKAWAVYARTPGEIRLQVWRAQPASAPGVLTYQLVDEKSFRISGFSSEVTFEADSFGGPTPVQEGDVIGWAHVGQGLIEYDDMLERSTSVYFLYGRPEVGDSADFSLGVKRAYSVRVYYDNATVRDTIPLPEGKGCYDQELGRFGLRCGANGAQGATVIAHNSSDPPLPSLNVFVYEGAVYRFSCCGDSLCNQEYCVRPADSCGPPPMVDNGVVTPNNTHVVFRQTVSVRCNAGYLPGLRDLNATDTPMCQRDGSFDRPIECFPIECGRYPAPKHAKVAPTWSLRTGEEVHITCNAGYSLRGEGSSRPQCRGDGSFEPGQICAPSDYGKVVGLVIGFFLLNAVLGLALAFVVTKRLDIKAAVLIWTEDLRLWARRRQLRKQGKTLEDDEWDKDGAPRPPRRNLNWVHGLWESLIQLFSPSSVRGGGAANSRIRQGDFIAVAEWDGVGPLPTAQRRKDPVGVGSAAVNVGWMHAEAEEEEGGEERREGGERAGEETSGRREAMLQWSEVTEEEEDEDGNDDGLRGPRGSTHAHAAAEEVDDGVAR